MAEEWVAWGNFAVLEFDDGTTLELMVPDEPDPVTGERRPMALSGVLGADDFDPTDRSRIVGRFVEGPLLTELMLAKNLRYAMRRR